LEIIEKYLVDTNIWLERMLDQEKSSTVDQFLSQVSTSQLLISDFSLHSIGVITTRLKKPEIFQIFINDLFFNAKIQLASLDFPDFTILIDNVNLYNLDFDDAYQLTISQKMDLTIVTFDKDFEAKGIKKKSPEEVLKNLP
jgi:uncharacterized protein